MEIVYGITVSDEDEEQVVNLAQDIVQNKGHVVVIYDEDKISPRMKHRFTWNPFTFVRGVKFNNDFAEFKNNLNHFCYQMNAKYIVQLDADEKLSKKSFEVIPKIIKENRDIDVFYVPRVNTVHGITKDHIKEWGWKMDEKGRINYPDLQGRIYKSHLMWVGRVHERIETEYYTILPPEFGVEIIHEKTIERQEKQNNFYYTLNNTIL